MLYRIFKIFFSKTDVISAFGKLCSLEVDVISDFGKLCFWKADVISDFGKLCSLKADIVSDFGKLCFSRGDVGSDKSILVFSGTKYFLGRMEQKTLTESCKHDLLPAASFVQMSKRCAEFWYELKEGRKEIL